jgi:hypothetical protein
MTLSLAIISIITLWKVTMNASNSPGVAAEANQGSSIGITEFRTRFLFPFYFERGAASRAANALLADVMPTGKPGDDGVPHWQRSRPHQLYTDEFLDHVVRYLFSNADQSHGADAPECGYLQIDAKIAQRWLKSAEVQLPNDRTVRIDPKTVRVEGFITSQGVGILSITLGASRGSIVPADVSEFNYRLSQFRRQPITGLVKPYPSVDTLSAEQKAAISPKPSATATIEERLFSPYGAFTLQEIVARLILLPLRQLSVRPVEARELAVYSVVRLPELDFADLAVRTAYGSQLSGLAQVEEHDHPGADPENLSVPAAVMNRRHWAAVGVLGAAHLVADETDPAGALKEFNNSRVQVVCDKYFISFLVTMLQRMTLNRAVDEAADIFSQPARQRATRTAQLRQDLLRFGVGGQFNQINSRHAHHRYYRLCREGLDVIPAWEDIRGILAELDADRLAHEQMEQQQRLESVAQELGANVVEIKRLQSVVHVIEYLLGFVYGAHFLHMMLAENHVVQVFTEEHFGFDRDGYVMAVTWLGALLGLLFVCGADVLHGHRTKKHGNKESAV